MPTEAPLLRFLNREQRAAVECLLVSFDDYEVGGDRRGDFKPSQVFAITPIASYAKYAQRLSDAKFVRWKVGDPLTVLLLSCRLPIAYP